VAAGSRTVRVGLKSRSYMAPITAGLVLFKEGELQRQSPQNLQESAKNEYNATRNSKTYLMLFWSKHFRRHHGWLIPKNRRLELDSCSRIAADLWVIVSSYPWALYTRKLLACD